MGVRAGTGTLNGARPVSCGRTCAMKLSPFSLLAALTALAGCTGNIDGPGAASGGSSGLTPGATSGSAGTSSNPGVVEQGNTSPDGVGWATRFPKLSNAQWEASVTDLFYFAQPTGLSQMFTPEPADGGYDNEAAAGLTVAGDSWVRYQLASEELAKLVAGDAQKLGKLVPASAPSSGVEKARATIADLGLRTYRRPLTTTEVDAVRRPLRQGRRARYDGTPSAAA